MFISAVIVLLVGSASALFLVSLEWATRFRESHIWIIWLLLVAGFVTGYLYYYLGKDVETSYNLLLDNIHSPSKIIPLRMAPLVLISTIITLLWAAQPAVK
ncbi:hypothetical protein [Dyadobacter psychrotolerans]|uniref:hypothetical protein n=1 Tax=Dyadobacter psychrotolerans TaxID=2541721 RepID=UPI001C716654|nr:hypothetical protein [Dyadobacter psychrotolerans]